MCMALMEVKWNTIMDHWWNNTGKVKVGVKSFPLPLCPPQIPCILTHYYHINTSRKGLGLALLHRLVLGILWHTFTISCYLCFILMGWLNCVMPGCEASGSVIGTCVSLKFILTELWGTDGGWVSNRGVDFSDRKRNESSRILTVWKGTWAQRVGLLLSASSEPIWRYEHKINSSTCEFPATRIVFIRHVFPIWAIL
jgi:hypothetical protein